MLFDQYIPAYKVKFKKIYKQKMKFFIKDIFRKSFLKRPSMENFIFRAVINAEVHTFPEI